MVESLAFKFADKHLVTNKVVLMQLVMKQMKHIQVKQWLFMDEKLK